MNLDEFRRSITAEAPPQGLAPLLQALWFEAKGDWKRAHEIAQAHDDRVGARVHAYLHRREGDLDNANYWYRRAQESAPQTSLEEEWAVLADRFLAW
jgi:hypothetical protein